MRLHAEHVGRGAPLVLLHGWGLHSGVWADLVPTLAQRFEVHAIDLPGHGYSANAAVASFDDAADAVGRWVPHGAALCGWSLGGLLALRIAQAHPERVSSLVLAGSTPCFVQRADWVHAMPAADFESFSSRVSTQPRAAMARFLALNTVGGTRARELARALSARLDERGAPAADSLLAALGWLRDVDLRDALGGITCRTLVMQGDADCLAPPGAGRWLAAQLHDARLLEFTHCAHVPFLSHRAEFARALEGFIA